jgi:nicotinate-nucleotide adenylyltransferase
MERQPAESGMTETPKSSHSDAATPDRACAPDSAIGLFGGSFNPPHLAHALVVAWALAEGGVGEVWVIPTGGHPFGKPLAPFDDRLEMCRRAFAWAGDRVRVLDAEREPRTHYTIETIERLVAAHPGRRWRWIMGADTRAEAGKWKDFGRIEGLAPPLVIPRGGNVTADAQGAAANPEAFALPDVSSSWIRARLAEGAEKAVAPLLPAGVLAWIRERGLYPQGQ